MNNIKYIAFNYTSPFEFKLDEGVEFNKAINIFVGPNGSGKTLLLVHAYIGTTILSLIEKGADPQESAQLVVANSLDDHEEFNGEFYIVMEDESRLEVTIEDGKATVNFHVLHDGGIAPLRYMSTSMRTFKPIHQYLSFRKSIAKGKDVLDPEGMSKMLSFFKMYDSAYLEALIAHCPVTLPDLTAYDFGDDYPVTLDVNLTRGEFYVETVDGNRKSVLRYGNGHQAILNMMAGTSM